MARPGRNIEQALLASGRTLYAQYGSERLTVRMLAEHAGVNASMFHYHFQTKDAFLRQLLGDLYEEMFGQLSGLVGQQGAPLLRLRGALFFLACFVRDHRQMLVRVLADAMAGQAVAAQFLRANAPRHLKLLLELMEEAQGAGVLAPTPAFQRFIFLMGAVAMPVLVAPGMQALGVAPRVLGPALQSQVMSDEAIAQRVDLALKALKPVRRRA
jgi:AcrR family transcriptional regulator